MIEVLFKRRSRRTMKRIWKWSDEGRSPMDSERTVNIQRAVLFFSYTLDFVGSCGVSVCKGIKWFSHFDIRLRIGKSQEGYEKEDIKMFFGSSEAVFPSRNANGWWRRRASCQEALEILFFTFTRIRLSDGTLVHWYRSLFTLERFATSHASSSSQTWDTHPCSHKEAF